MKKDIKKCNKCCNINRDERKCTCKKSLNHLNRIEGQIKTLKKYIDEGRRCKDVAMLSASIAKSFDTLRARTLKNYILNDVLNGKKIEENQKEEIEQILKLYKK